MSTLLISLGTSPAVVPEAFLLPEARFGAVHVLTTEKPDVQLIRDYFAKHAPGVELTLSRVAGFDDFASEADHFRFEEVLYRWVLASAPDPASRFFCLSGGFKTMSAAMQKAAAGYGWFNEVSAAKQEPTTAVPLPQSVSGSSPLQTDEEGLIEELRRLATTTGNFPALFPRLKAIADDALLKRIFNAVIPAQELRNTRLNSPYWQSFKSKPDGTAILRRVGLLPK